MRLLSARNLQGCTIAATDGDIGSVHDLYFDDLRICAATFAVAPLSW